MLWLTRGDIEILLDRRDGARHDFVVSAYVDHRIKDGFHRYVDVVLRDQGRSAGLSLGDPRLRKALDANLGAIRKAADTADPSAQGLAVFSGADRGLFHAVTLDFPVANYLAIDEEPYVLPLLERWYGEPSYLVAVVDSHQAVLFEAHVGTIEAVRTLSHEADADVQREKPRLTYQKRFAGVHHERLRVADDDAFLKGVAGSLAGAWRAGAFGGMIVLGQPRNVATVRRLLPRDVAPAVVETGPQAMTERPEDIADDVKRALESWRSQRRSVILGELQHRWKERHLVANGPTEVLDAIQQGRAVKVVIGAQRDLSGARCGSCGYHFGAPVGQCAYCDSPTQAVNAVQEILRMSLRHRIPVHLLDRDGGIDPLATVGGVSALLRAEANWAPESVKT